MTQITYQANAFINTSYDSIDAVQSGRTLPLVLKTDKVEGYTNIGKATVTVELVSTDEFVSNQISSLNAELQTVRSESQRRENAILLQISKLQALTMG